MTVNKSLQQMYRSHHGERRRPNLAINEAVRGQLLRE